MGTNVPTINPAKRFTIGDELIGVSDLKDLISSGKKFSTIYADPAYLSLPREEKS